MQSCFLITQSIELTTNKSKIIVFVAGLIGLIVLIAVVAALVLRANAQPRLEAVASKALDMEVNVNGRLTAGFFPRFHVALTDVRARKHGAEIASAKEVDVGMQLLPLLHGEARIKTIGLNGLRIAIERDREGKLNAGGSSRIKDTRPPLDVTKVSVSDAALLYTNAQSGKALQAKDCNLEVSGLRLPSGESANVLKNLSLAAKFACGQVQTKELTAYDVKASVQGKDGVFNLDPITMRLFGGQGSGNIRADFSGSVPAHHLRYSLAKFRIDDFFRFMSPKNTGRENAGDGVMDFSANLSLRGKSADELKRTAEGEASLQGKNLRLHIGDLDEKFSRYEASQNFNLVDVGAVFFAGPLGLGLTKGYDFARIFEGSGGSTVIRTVVSNWQVEGGIAHAADVAMATQKHRVALKGGLDFASGRFDDVTVALIDAKGCARVQQRIRGPFRQPEVEKANVLSALAGPTRKLLERAKGLLGGKCEVFYAGSVAPPN